MTGARTRDTAVAQVVHTWDVWPMMRRAVLRLGLRDTRHGAWPRVLSSGRPRGTVWEPKETVSIIRRP